MGMHTLQRQLTDHIEEDGQQVVGAYLEGELHVVPGVEVLDLERQRHLGLEDDLQFHEGVAVVLEGGEGVYAAAVGAVLRLARDLALEAVVQGALAAPPGAHGLRLVAPVQVVVVVSVGLDEVFQGLAVQAVLQVYVQLLGQHTM